jgi:hypothetical protein
MHRHVKGILFADYVRMIRSRKDVEWSVHLDANDSAFLKSRIDPDAWYPMATFERMGNAILREIAGGDVEAVRLWGRLSAGPLRASQPLLVAEGDPVETMMRFRVLRSSYFDFEALEVLTLIEGHAEIAIAYHMGATAEEAASMQTTGFFEGVLDAAGATDVQAALTRRSWLDSRAATLLDLRWTTPSQVR